eukprot:3931578-Prymnesium_polylepis.2
MECGLPQGPIHPPLDMGDAVDEQHDAQSWQVTKQRGTLTAHLELPRHPPTAHQLLQESLSVRCNGARADGRVLETTILDALVEVLAQL